MSIERKDLVQAAGTFAPFAVPNTVSAEGLSNFVRVGVGEYTAQLDPEYALAPREGQVYVDAANGGTQLLSGVVQPGNIVRILSIDPATKLSQDCTVFYVLVLRMAASLDAAPFPAVAATQPIGTWTSMFLSAPDAMTGVNLTPQVVAYDTSGLDDNGDFTFSAPGSSLTTVRPGRYEASGRFFFTPTTMAAPADLISQIRIDGAVPPLGTVGGALAAATQDLTTFISWTGIIDLSVGEVVTATIQSLEDPTAGDMAANSALFLERLRD